MSADDVKAKISMRIGPGTDLKGAYGEPAAEFNLWGPEHVARIQARPLVHLADGATTR